MLTPKQTQILEFVRDAFRRNGTAPSTSEITARFGFKSPNSVTKHLTALARKGVLKMAAGRARSIQLTGSHRLPRIVDIPIYGAISAGFSEIAEASSAERTVAVDAESLRIRDGAAIFGLSVRGPSMTGVGIFDGDTVLLEHGAEPRDGDVVAALIDDETSLKTFRKPRGKTAYLQAQHPDFPDLIPVRSLTIQGVFRALIRVGGRDER